MQRAGSRVSPFVSDSGATVMRADVAATSASVPSVLSGKGAPRGRVGVRRRERGPARPAEVPQEHYETSDTDSDGNDESYRDERDVSNELDG
jgi:hypothetical protein